MKKFMFVAVAAILAAATPAQAQYDDRAVHVNLGGGVAIPVSDVSERFGTGAAFQIGLLFEPPQSIFGFQVEYSYNRLSGEDKTIDVYPTPVAVVPTSSALIESHHSMQYITFNGILKPAGAQAVKPYFTGGGGAYSGNSGRSAASATNARRLCCASASTKIGPRSNTNSAPEAS